MNQFVIFRTIIATIFCSFSFVVFSQTTSWTGTSSEEWREATNWTNGVPDATKDAVIGDANFVGPNQPTLERGKGSGECKSLNIGSGVQTCTLTSLDNLYVGGDITIGNNGTILHTHNNISLTGDFLNSGVYTASGKKRTVIFEGESQMIGGSSFTSFEQVRIESTSTTTLDQNIVIEEELAVIGVLNPTASFSVSGTGSIELQGLGTIKVMASTYAANYLNSGGLTFKKSLGTVDYAASVIDQTVDETIDYRTLRISGGMTKTLQANTTVRNYLQIEEGTLDIATFTIDRNNNGGFLSVASGATLRIGGTQSFPSNYATHILASASTVEYYGANQVVASEDYGNLILSSSGGAVIKTMPTDPMTILGDLTSSASSGSLSFTASGSVTVFGDVTLGANTIFDGSSHEHQFWGDWTNEGVFTNTSGKLVANGGNNSWNGAGSFALGDVEINAAKVTLNAGSNLDISGYFLSGTGGSFTHSGGGSGAVNMSSSNDILAGNFVLSNLTIESGASINASLVFTISGDLIVDGALNCQSTNHLVFTGVNKVVSGSGAIQFNHLSIPTGSIITTSKSLSIGGNVLISGAFTATAGTITFNGNSNLSGTISVFDLLVDNASNLTMGVDASLNIAGTDGVIGTGIFDPTSNIPNTVAYNSSGAQIISFSDFYNLSFLNGDTKSTSAGITVYGDFIIGTATTFSGSTFSHTIQGNWKNQGSFLPGSSTIILSGSINSTIDGVTTFNALTVNKTDDHELTLNNDVTVASLDMTAGLMRTGASSITITSTRVGNGIILGTITRQHAFTTGTNYAFEGPNNFIQFTAIVGTINEITVVVDNESPSTFPYRESINRVYDIAVSGAITSYLATVRFHYETAELNGNDENNLSLWNDQGITSWISLGLLSSNSALDNWVEQTGLGSLENKWSLSDGLKVLSWTGINSSSVSDPGNWSLTAGVTTAPPGPDDVVVFGDFAFANHPVFDANTTIKRIIFESTQPTTVSIGAGDTLIISGDILGDWTLGNATHAINVGGEVLMVNGNLELSDGTTGHEVNLTATSGSISVLGNIIQDGGSVVSFTNTATLHVEGDYLYGDGTFVSGNSTVVFDGANNQLVAGLNYHHLTIDKSSGLVTTGDAIQVNGDFLLSDGEFNLDHNLDLNGDFTVDTGTIFNSGNGNSISLAGSMLFNGTFNSETTNFILDGTTDQDVVSATFYNIEVNKASGVANMVGDISIKGNAHVNNGTLDVGTHSITRTSSGGAAIISSGGTALFAGGSTQVQNFATMIIDPASTVHFNGSISRVIPPFNYGNLIISNAGTKSLIGNTGAQSLTVESDGTLDISGYSFSLGGDLTVLGELETTDSYLELNGTDDTIEGTITFDAVQINGSYDYVSGSPTFAGHVEIGSTGDLDLGTSTVVVSGNYINRGITQSNGVVTFTGTQQQTIRLLNAISSSSTGVINFNGNVAPVLSSTTSPQYATVNINNTAGITPSSPWTVEVNMNIASGASFNGGSLTHTIKGNFNNNGTFTSEGVVNFNSINFPTSITLGDDFTTSGLVVFGGDQAVTLTDNTPQFNLVTISNSNLSGISASSNWQVESGLYIDSEGTFKAGSFSHTVSGDFVNQGILDGESSTMIFDGNTGSDVIAGSGVSTFNHLTIATGTVLEVLSSIQVTGNMVHNATTLDLASSVVEFTGTEVSNISGTAINFNDLVINKNGNSVELGVNISVDNTVSMTDGFLGLNGNTLTISNPISTAINRTNGLILSELSDNTSRVDWAVGTELGAHEIPFGNASGDYIPFVFDLNSGDAGLLSVATYPTTTNNLPLPSGVLHVNRGNFDNSANVVDRFFQIDLSGDTTPSASITLSASASEVGSIINLVGQRWNGTNWDGPLPGQSNTSNSVTVPNVTQFSPWVMSGNDTPLPVELVAFNANQVKEEVKLEWQTASEQSNKGFFIERSDDGHLFHSIGFKEGKGDSKEIENYSFEDFDPIKGLGYYRLKQVDFDGAFEYSAIKSVIWEGINDKSISAYPNPLKGSYLKLHSSGFSNTEIQVLIRDLNGELVMKEIIHVDYDQELSELLLPKDLAQGLYIIEFTQNEFTRQEKLLYQGL